MGKSKNLVKTDYYFINSTPLKKEPIFAAIKEDKISLV